MASYIIYFKLDGYFKTPWLRAKNCCVDLKIEDRKICSNFMTPELIVSDILPL